MRYASLALVKSALGAASLSHIKSARSVSNLAARLVYKPQPYLRKLSVQEVTLGTVATNLIAPLGQASKDSVLVYFHGGGFVFGSPDIYRFWTCQLAQQTGLPTIVPAYRLAPENPHPTQLIDCLATVMHCQARFGPKNMILAGDSAGGNLVLTVLLALQNPTLFLQHIKEGPICSPPELDYIETLLKNQKPNVLGIKPTQLTLFFFRSSINVSLAQFRAHR